MRQNQFVDENLPFPDPESALRNPNGLLAIGGELSTSRLLTAYQRGIFPWYSPGDPVLWWSPDPRAVLWPEQFHLSRSMRRFHRRSPFKVTLNYAFSQVITGCAAERAEGTWITPEIIAAYSQLHAQGVAHSIEVWWHDKLVGGLYGIAQGALFCGESMFSHKENASKTALMLFCEHFLHHQGKLIDCQILNHHTASLGAVEISRHQYLNQLRILQKTELSANCWLPQTLF